MSRIGLLSALAIAVAVGVVFAIYPTLDLDIAAPFFHSDTGLWTGVYPPLPALRHAASWLIALVAAPAAVAVVLKLILPRRPMIVPGRAAVLMLVTLALGPGLLVNVILKEHWNRPRPIDVAEFRGQQHFVPWWDPRGECAKNCSFVAGEPSGAFWTLAAAAVTPPQWRVLAYATALAFGAAVGLLRIAGGGHFFTDVVFGAVFTFLVIWFTHGFLYRWRTRIADESVERLIERITMKLRGK